MSKGVHNIAFYVSPDPECSRTTQNSEISLAPSRGRILYAIYGNSTCVINHIVVTAIDKMYRNYYVSTKAKKEESDEEGDLSETESTPPAPKIKASKRKLMGKELMVLVKDADDEAKDYVIQNAFMKEDF